MRSAGGRQAEVRLQPRQTFRLCASRNRADRHAGRLSIGLRSHGRQHLGQDDTEGVSSQDREAIWQGQAHVGDGSRHSDGRSVGREVKFIEHEEEIYVLARSQGRRDKEQSMRRRRLKKLIKRLRELQRQDLTRDDLLLKLGAAKKEAGKAYGLLVIHMPTKDQPVTSETFHFALDRKKLRQARRREGSYLLRSDLKSDDPGHLWRLYSQLVEVEQVFKDLKNDLAVRPIYHQLETRIEAHIFIAFLAYCLLVTLKQRLKALAPGLTARVVLEKLATMQMIDVELPTTDDRVVVLSRYTEPEKDLSLLLRQLKLQLPAQPPPKIMARNIQEVA